jgi:hypothetical protein
VFIGPPKKTQLASDPAAKRAPGVLSPKPAATQNAALGTTILPAQGFIQGNRPMAYTNTPEQGAEGGVTSASDVVPMPRPRPKRTKRAKR